MSSKSDDGCPVCGQTECPECDGMAMVWESDMVTHDDGTVEDQGYSRPCLTCDGEGYVS